MSTTGIFIGRFQADTIPSGLKTVLAGFAAAHETKAIVLGLARTGFTRRNPIDSRSRREMIAQEFDGIPVYTIDDHPSDEEWSQQLDGLVRKNFPDGEITLYGSEDNFAARYHGKFKVISTGTSHSPYETETPWNPAWEFRQGMIYALKQTYAKVYPTVDLAVFRKKRSEVLLGMKAIEEKWRFPGGFTDPSDNSYEEAALRELKEECGLSWVTTPTYEASFKVDDWRYRHEDDKIITILFSAELIVGDPKPGDDIAEARWFSLHDVKAMVTAGKTAAEHEPLFRHLMSKYAAKG
jgi:bifunctional NMN adenylyltransferase/nudix hydrolase